MAAAAIVSKPSKWFSSKSLKLSFPRLLSKSKSSTSTTTATSPKKSSKEEQLRQVFRHFDSDGDGMISCQELRSYFVSVGESMSYEEVQRVIKDFDTNCDNLLEFQEFVRLMEGNNNEVDDDKLRRAFNLFEADKGSGCITPRGLQQMLNRLGDARSYEDCVEMIRVFDLDANGVLDFHEFRQMMACP